MTLIEVLAPYGIDENEFVDELARDLRKEPAPSASRLSDADALLLDAHSGNASALVEDLDVDRADLRSSTSNLAEQIRTSLSVEQTAMLLGIDGSRVRHRVRDHALYAFRIGSGLRLPIWQFEGDVPIPGLRSLLAAVPAKLHPLEVAGFMTTPDPELRVDGAPSSPRAWIVGGGDIRVVLEVIGDLDAW